jgi:tetratricopeptide (TPR) repeat protein
MRPILSNFAKRRTGSNDFLRRSFAFFSRIHADPGGDREFIPGDVAVYDGGIRAATPYLARIYVSRHGKTSSSQQASARLRVAGSLWAAGRFDEAIRKCNEAVRLAPNDPAVLIEAAQALGKRYQIQRSEGLLERAVRLAPRSVEVQHAVGEVYLVLNRPANAEACFRRSCQLSATSKSLFELAKLCERTHALEEANELVDRILRAEPRSIPALLLRARLERRLGDTGEAISTLRRIVVGTAGHPMLLAQAYGELCTTLDSRGEFDAAWDAVLRCKEIMLQHASAAWQAAQFVLGRCRRMVEALSRTDFERWRWTPEDRAAHRLALLTGFPRTGTSLMERVLDAHPQVVSSEEKEVFSAEVFPALGTGRPADAPIGQLLDEASRERIAAARLGYLEAMESMLGEKIESRLHVDKNPAMNLMIPPMRRIFPELKLVIALRDPRDVIVSCFLRYLPINPVSVCFLTLERTVDRYLLDMGAWLTMREMIDSWIEVRYEKMVADLQHEAGELFEFLELPWDKAVLAYREHAGRKLVQSPSYEEVARPIFTTSVGRWQNYERHLAPELSKLAPLVKALGYDT